MKKTILIYIILAIVFFSSFDYSKSIKYKKIQDNYKSKSKKIFDDKLKLWKIDILNKKSAKLHIPSLHLKYPRLNILDYKYLQTANNKIVILYKQQARQINILKNDILVLTKNNNFLYRKKHLYKIID